MTKTQILEYLSFAPEELDLLKFAQWLELYSEGTFYVEKGKRPEIRNKFDLSFRVKKMTEEEIDKIHIFATQCHNKVDEFRYRLTNNINFQMEQFREELLKEISIFTYDIENLRENNKEEQNNE